MSATLKYNDVEDDRRSDHRTIFLVMIGIAMIPIIVYAAAVLVTWGKLPRGTFVSGVDVGGRTPAEAKALLRAELDPRAEAPVPMTAEEVSTSVIPAESGLTIDYDSTVDGLASSAINPITVARSFSGRTDHDPKLVVDDAAIAKTVDAFAKKVDKPKREGSVKLDGAKVVTVNPLVGRTLDRAAAVKTLHERFAELSTDPVDVPVTPIDVVMSQEEVDAGANVIKPVVSGPVRLVADGRGIDLSLEQILSLISLKTDAAGATTVVVDAAKVKALVTPALTSFDAPSKDASIDVIGGAVRIVPSINGRTADVDALVAQFEATLSRPAPRELPIPFKEVEPKLTTEKVKALGIKQVVGTFTTKFPCCKPRVNNIHRIADIVDGGLVLPGETYSLNGFVGERDRARGFGEAPMIENGKLVPAVGGGVSQFATTMFNAVFFSGLKDIEHKPHSFYISRYPAGREATVSYPQPDLKWQNDHPTGILIKTSHTGTSVTVTFWGTKQYDEIRSISGARTRPTVPKVVYLEPGPKCIPVSAGVNGFDIVVWREFWKGGRQVKPRERFYTRYLPENIFHCAPDPSKAPPPGTVPPPGGTTPPVTPPAAPPPAKPAPPASSPPATG